MACVQNEFDSAVRSANELSLTGHIRVRCQLATLEWFGKKVKNTYAVPDDYIRRNKEGVAERENRNENNWTLEKPFSTPKRIYF